MTKGVAYIPGERDTAGGPLRRFLPPVPGGVGAAWLRGHLPSGKWVLDPFGASPRMAIEAARAGYRVLTAANNPISRFLIDLHANPPGEEELRLALADLSAAQKSGERLEPHLRSLYRTRCQNCGAEVEAQAFVWERGTEAPAARIYTCPNCKDSGERPASEQDAELARRFVGGALHKARALERVAPLDDPDRVFVEEALGMYLPRAVYALFTLVNKLESFPAERRRGMETLLLAAFDSCSTLWAHPATRARPRQLITPPRFLERNVWLALEEAVLAWPAALHYESGKNRDLAGRTPLTAWPVQPPETGGICLFEGRLRDLAGQLAAAQGIQPDAAATGLAVEDPEDGLNEDENENAPGEPVRPIEIMAVLSVLPRPNQAFWTLSALWSGWLWGHEASAAFKSVLRRRRYDWDWHAAALHANLQHLAEMAEGDLPALCLVAEAEPGFLSAALAAGSRAGLELGGVAVRADEAQAQIHWSVRRLENAGQGETAESDTAGGEVLAVLAQRAAQETLSERGEPSAYIILHAAIVEQAVLSGQWPAAHENLETALSQMNTAIEMALASRAVFARYGGGRSLEAGLWWAASNRQRHSKSAKTGNAAHAAPLADRVEMEAVRFLVKHPDATARAVDTAICAAFPGRLTPDRELVRQIQNSYCVEVDENGLYRMRAEDAPAARTEDLQSLQALLQLAGKRLGFAVKTFKVPGGRQGLQWKDPITMQGYEFYVIASAVAGELLSKAALKTSLQPVLVLPGGRAALMEFKLQRDPRLHQALKTGWRLAKYRHMRRLADDPDLTLEMLEARLDLDPLENRDPQMSLF